MSTQTTAWTGLSTCVIRCICMETTESKATSNFSVYMYFADISIVNSGVREAYAHTYVSPSIHVRTCKSYLPFGLSSALRFNRIMLA